MTWDGMVNRKKACIFTSGLPLLACPYALASQGVFGQQGSDVQTPRSLYGRDRTIGGYQFLGGTAYVSVIRKPEARMLKAAHLVKELFKELNVDEK